MIKSILISPEGTRLRAGWRLLLQTLILLLFTFLFGVLIGLLNYLTPIPFGSLLLEVVVATFTYTGSVFVARRWLDRRSIVSIGLKLDRQAFLDLFVGFSIALLVMCLSFVIVRAANWLTFDSFAWQIEPPVIIAKNIGSALVFFLLAGWYEELLVRGYYLKNLTDGLNPLWAIIISSALFGVGHIPNPNATWNSVLGIFLLGIFLAYPCLRTGQIWMSIGLHIGWNFFQGTIFGFSVSGLNFYHLLHTTINGPDLWTGGAFGPEAGLVIFPGLLLGTALVWLYTEHTSRRQE